jgi:hypothetical protein
MRRQGATIMPSYTITTNNGDGTERTQVPLKFRDTKAATDDAQVALSDMAREKLPDGKHAELEVSVKDDAGKHVYRAGLSFTAKDEGDLERGSANADAAADDVANSLGGHGPRE